MITSRVIHTYVSWLTTVAVIVALGATICSAQSVNCDQTLKLGGQEKNEKLAVFKARFPGSICGAPPAHGPLNRHTLNDRGKSEWLVCCVDDPKEVSAFSDNKVLTLNRNCPVRLSFHQGRLNDIGFAVDASLLDQLLPGLEKKYGPSHLFEIRGGKGIPIRLASWRFGDVALELNEQLLAITDYEIDPAPENRSAEAKIVLVDLF